MAETITWGHVLVLAGVHPAHQPQVKSIPCEPPRAPGRGPPHKYRAALYALAIAVVLFAAGWLTPLWDSAIL